MSLKVFIKYVSSKSGIISIYSRNSYANDTFKPGYSDIDLVYIIDERLNESETWKLIKKNSRRVVRYGGYFPMIDDIKFYNYLDFIELWDVKTIQKYTYAWNCEYGFDFVRDLDHIRLSPNEKIEEALRSYYNSFYNNLHQYLNERIFESSTVYRSYYKVLRFLNAKGIENLDLSNDENIISVITDLLLKLDSSVKNNNSVKESFLYKVVEKGTTNLSSINGEKSNSKIPNVVSSIFLDYIGLKRAFVILDSDIGYEIEEGVKYFLSNSEYRKMDTYFFTKETLNFFFKDVRPHLYFIFIRNFKVIYGSVHEKVFDSPNDSSILNQIAYDIDFIISNSLSLWLKTSSFPELERIIYQMLKRLSAISLFYENGEYHIDPMNTLLYDKLLNKYFSDLPNTEYGFYKIVMNIKTDLMSVLKINTVKTY